MTRASKETQDRLASEFWAKVVSNHDDTTRNRYQVIVGNIGRVYHGNDADEASRIFKEYSDQSVHGYSRAAGEPVTLMDGEHIVAEN